MDDNGSVDVNGGPKVPQTEYEENGRLYSTFRRYDVASLLAKVC